MKYLDLTHPTAAENLAFDEALLDWCESGADGEILRFWEPRDEFVVVGYANHIEREVNLEACQAGGVAVYRRCSGGGTVLQGSGCLNYALILKICESGPMSAISGTNTFILRRHQAAVEALLGKEVKIEGCTDLAVGRLKFSGNSQRRKRKFLIFHGTFLLQFDIARVGKFLSMPSKQPEYRNNRPHGEFLTNLNLSNESIKSALRKAWNTTEPLLDFPAEKVRDLALQKYSTDSWNFKF